MREFIRQELLRHSKKTIVIEEIESLLAGHALSYHDFAQLILSLEDEGVLELVKAKGRNSRTPSIGYSYRIQKHQLKEDYHQEIKQYRLQLHPSIHLDTYFRLDPSEWKKDLPYLLLIDQYIKRCGFPNHEVPAPERSVELVGDEKWITEKLGKELLERVTLWSIMKVIPVSDPLMFAVNAIQLTNRRQKHLIVENKTTYQALLDSLRETEFSSLIYGSGNKIIKSIEQFDHQLQLPEDVAHDFFYFGDIDRSGMFIWYRLNQIQPVQLALPFYQACIGKPALKGKTNQRIDQTAINEFLSNFTMNEQKQLKAVLANGKYYPQEVLRTRELQNIWRNATWN